MNLMTLAHFTAFIIYLLLILLVAVKNPKAALNKVCALLIGTFAIWSLASSFFYAASSPDNARLWFNISAFGGCSFASFSLWFSLKLTNHQGPLKKWYFYALLFVLPGFFIYLHWAGRVAYMILEPDYRTMVWPMTPWTIPFYGYYLSFMLIAIRLIYKHGRDARYEYERKQARLIVITGGISLVLASVNVVILPNINYYLWPSMGSIIPLIWIAGMVYAITKYKLLALTPAYAAADILRAMSDSLILIGPDGKLIDANTATFKLSGFSREELIGRPVETLLKTTGVSFANGAPLLEQLLQLNSFKNHRCFCHTKNGTLIPVSISGSVLRDLSGAVIGIVGVARDLREIIRLQAKERDYVLEKARTEALKEQARELQQAYDQLNEVQAQLVQTEKLAAVGQLAGGVAHEINNPMSIILGFAQGVVKRITADHPLVLPLQSIEREAVRCKKLVGDLLTFSRAGKTQAEVIDLNSAIDETLALIEAGAKMKNIEIRKQYGAGLPPITFNKSQLQQVIFNICMNAIDAMPDGGRLTVCAGNHDPTEIEIAISDTGHGITAEVKSHLFEPFFTTKEVGKGTGLGLSLCYEIIRKNHGVIDVASEVGQGSMFKIKLPLSESKKGKNPARR